MDRCRNAFRVERMLSKGLAFGAILTRLGTRNKARCPAVSTHGARIKAGRGQKKATGVLTHRAWSSRWGSVLCPRGHRSQEGQAEMDRIPSVLLNTRLGEWL